MNSHWKLKTKSCFAFMLVLLVCSLIGTGCSKKNSKKYSGYYVFYPDANETKVGNEKIAPKAKTTNGLVREFLKKLQQEPKDISLKKAIPNDVKIEEYSLDESNYLTLYFNASYANLSGVSEILRRASIVKTLCQVKDILGVQFYVAGQPLTDSNSTAIGYMNTKSFIDSTGGESAYKQTTTLSIYFADKTGGKLTEVPVDITYDATVPLEQLAIEQLMEGPYSINGVNSSQVLPTIPEKTVLNKISVKEHTCYVDFSSEFLNTRKGVSPEATIYSVVNTLAELPNINKVHFSINGEQVLLYNDTIDFGSVFERNLDIVNEPQ